MFCFQREFIQPTETVTQQLLRDLLNSPQTRWLTQEHRRWREQMPSIIADEKLQEEWAKDEEFQKFCIEEPVRLRKQKAGKKKAEVFEALSLPKKMQTYCDSLKKSLPFVIFIATYDETPSTNGQKMGAWRKQAACKLNGLCVIDYDHIEGDVRKVWVEAFNKLSDEDKAKILFVFVTPSGHGLKVVFMADPAIGNLIDNQIVFSLKLGLNPDESCKDASRGAFLTTIDDVILINEEELINYENEEFGKKYNESYHAGKSQSTIDVDKARADYGINPTVQAAGEDQRAVSGGDGGDSRDAESLMYHGVPYSKIVAAWLGDKKIEQGDRHRTSLILADHLRYITDNDPVLIEQILRQTPFVMEIVKERNEDVAGTVNSAQGYDFLKGIPKRMQKALEKVGATSSRPCGEISGDSSTMLGMTGGGPSTGSGAADIYSSLPLDKWAEELQEMAAYYPCMKELFLNVHPHKLAAVWFSSAALFGTLMTRAWYHFWFEPELVRRLNYCIFIIGDPGAGKNIVEKFYKKIADPMIQADQCLIDAVNRYKENRTERTTSTKAQKGEALKRPVVPIRVHPARTATGEFIRHMNAAVETVQGVPLHLHMFSFDAELDNVTKQNKGGDWKDREVMELKAFHNEEEGQMYANQESYTGMFNIYWNFIYTGTPYALHRKVNQRNFGTGMSTRLAVIPLPDRGRAKRHQEVDPNANETLKTWAYRLDRVEGEMPIEPLNDETYDWQSSHLEIADFNDDKADRSLLKRIPYYGIGISLPFILMRHWDEWQESKTLTMDDMDKRLCRLAMDIQYKCQQFYFGEMAFNYFADQNKEFVQRRRSTRYDECFRKLPEEFKTQQFMEVFGCSNATAARAISRFKEDGIIESAKYGVYRKKLMELP